MKFSHQREGRAGRQLLGQIWAVWSLCLGPMVYAGPTAPEIASGYTAKSAVSSKHQMIVTATPLSSQAGLQMLQRGGTAVDAAIAAQAMLGLTEPQSSGIAGGAFMIHFDGQNVSSFDGRETAPAAAKPDRFMLQGREMDFDTAVVGGRSVGVPGVLAMLAQAHKKYGKLTWAQLFLPAIHQAERGFPMSPRLHAALKGETYLKFSEPARSYFYLPDGRPKPVGSLLKNPSYAATLRLIARQGIKAFYDGPISVDIVRAVVRHRANPGDMTLADLKQYRAKERSALCEDYRGNKVCTVPPPSSGGIAVLQMLKVMEHFPLANYSPLSVDAVHVFSEAGRLAFADRAKYVADPDFVSVPTRQLLDSAYLAQRAQQIDMQKSMHQATPGVLTETPEAWGLDNAVEWPCTSDIEVVDRYGAALSMTSSIENAFGSHIMVPGRGFMLNNQLTDFSFNPEQDGKPVANRVEAGKRPRSAMSPVLVFGPDGKLKIAAGSPGGSSIINYVAQTLVAMLDWRLDPQQAVSLPHYGSRNRKTELEAGRGLEGVGLQLQARNHEVSFIDLNSGLAAIARTPDGWIGGADPRREGLVLGD